MLPCFDGQGNITYRIAGRSLIAIGNILQLDAMIRRFLPGILLLQRLNFHDLIHTLQGIDQIHLGLAGIGDLGQRHGNKRRHDNVVHDVKDICT